MVSWFWLGGLVAGVLVGIFLRPRQRSRRFISSIGELALYVLLFSLGAAVATDQAVTAHAAELVLQALLLGWLPLVGSVAAAWLLHSLIAQR